MEGIQLIELDTVTERIQRREEAQDLSILAL